MEKKVIDIFEEAKGKLFTYLVLELSNGTSIQTCIEGLKIDQKTNEKIYLQGKIWNGLTSPQFHYWI